MRSSLFEEGGVSSSAAGTQQQQQQQQQPANKRKRKEPTAEEREKNNARHRRDRAKKKEEVAKLKEDMELTKDENCKLKADLEKMQSRWNQIDDFMKHLKVTNEMAQDENKVMEACWNKMANSGPVKDVLQDWNDEDRQLLADMWKTPSPPATMENGTNNHSNQETVSKLAKEVGTHVSWELGSTSSLVRPSDGNNLALVAQVAGKGKGPLVEGEDIDNESLKMASEQGGNEVITAADFGYGDLRGVKMTDFEGYRIPEKLHPTATSLLRGIPTILPTTSKSIRIYNLRTDIVICLCAAVLEIENTPYAKMGYDEIRRWRGAIHEAKCVGFDVDLIGSGLEHIVERLNTSTPGPFMYWKDI